MQSYDPDEIYSAADSQLEGREIPEFLRRLVPLSNPKEEGVRGPTNMAQSERVSPDEALVSLGINLSGENPFIVLGLTTSSTQEEARNRFRAAVKIVHPDRCVGFEGREIFQGRTPEEAFDIVNKAYVAIEEFRASGRFDEDVAANEVKKSDSRSWIKKLFGGTGLVRKDPIRASDDDWDALALVVNALNTIVDSNIAHQASSYGRPLDSFEHAKLESSILHEALSAQIGRISAGARKAAVEAFEGTTASDEHQRRRATSILAQCLDRGLSVEQAQVYAAMRLYIGRQCDRGGRWY